MANEILIEGNNANQLLEMLDEPSFKNEIISGKPIVFKIGNAQILAQFEENDNSAVIDLVHIDGGGEGVLLAFINLAKSYCRTNNIHKTYWYIHARNCANPNQKLQRILELKNFKKRFIQGRGDVFFKEEIIS
ncbi:MAG TPA: hypothetical protein VEC36_07640 [Patescibacteria group bacterium]|nr:hypothetical protein [Patescibacteria group bacterium]